MFNMINLTVKLFLSNSIIIFSTYISIVVVVADESDDVYLYKYHVKWTGFDHLT